jgi:hypothetical protein
MRGDLSSIGIVLLDAFVRREQISDRGGLGDAAGKTAIGFRAGADPIATIAPVYAIAASLAGRNQATPVAIAVGFGAGPLPMPTIAPIEKISTLAQIILTGSLNHAQARRGPPGHDRRAIATYGGRMRA